MTDTINTIGARESKAADQISTLINSMGLDKEHVGAALANDHRTLQSEFMRVVIGFLDAMAENQREGWTDARNEVACELADHFMRTLEGTNMLMTDQRGQTRVCLPFI